MTPKLSSDARNPQPQEPKTLDSEGLVIYILGLTFQTAPHVDIADREACREDREMDAHDYRVNPLTVEQLESRALFFRNKWGYERASRLSAFELLFENMPSSLVEAGLRMILRTAGFMGLREAYATTKPKRIFYRGRLYSQLRLGDDGAAFIFLHELGHILLHPGAPKAWLTAGYEKVAYIEEEQSAEWQATMFALCLRSPAHLSGDCHSAEALGKKFGLTAEHAQTRFEILARRRPRKVPKLEQAKIFHSLEQSEASILYQERCPDCGAFLSDSKSPRPKCYICCRYGDKFQDGDTFGLDY